MLARALVVVLTISAVSVSLADEAEERFVASVRAAIQEREAKRAELQEHLRELQAGRVNRAMRQREMVTEARGRKRYVWNSPEAKKKAVAEVQRQIEQLDSTKISGPDLSFGEGLAVGQIGRLPHSSGTMSRLSTYQYQILQIIDDDNALMSWVRNIHTSATSTERGGSRLVWLKTSTKGMADGQSIDAGGTYRVIGTTQYDTAGGTPKTVFVLKPVDVQPLIEKAKQPAPQPQ